MPVTETPEAGLAPACLHSEFCSLPAPCRPHHRCLHTTLRMFPGTLFFPALLSLLDWLRASLLARPRARGQSPWGGYSW